MILVLSLIGILIVTVVIAIKVPNRGRRRHGDDTMRRQYAWDYMNNPVAKEIKRNGQPISKDLVVRQKLAQFYIEATVLKYIVLRGLTHQLREGRPGSEGAIASVMGMEFNQRLQNFAMQLQGSYSQLVRSSKHAIENGRWQYGFLRSRGNTIETGTSEIKRNIIAQRVLGLPR